MITKKIKEFFLGEELTEEEKAYEAELKTQFKKDALRVKYDNKLKALKEGKKCGISQLGESLMKASDKVKNHDFLSTGSNNKKGFYLLK
jgi:hypothetical protein